MLRPQTLFLLLFSAASGLSVGCSDDTEPVAPVEFDGGDLDANLDTAPDTTLPDTELPDTELPDTELPDSAMAEDSADTELPDTALDADLFETFDAVSDVDDVAEAETADAPADVDAGPPVVCTSTSINDVSFGTNKEVRQGYGSLQLNVVGSNLAGITSAALGGAACTIVLKTATTALVTCSVAHGAPLGGMTLVLSNGNASGACANAITVTKIITDAASLVSSDTSGLGTPYKPFKSIGRSLSVADSGDVVTVLANGATGSYGVGTGDSFISIGTSTNPYGTPTANVRAGVTIEGDTRTGMVTRIIGAKNAGNLVFRLAGGATLKNLVLDGFRYSISTNAGALTLQNVSFKNAGGDALVVFGAATATVSGTCDFDAIEGSGVNTAGSASVTMTGCTLHNHSSSALLVTGTSTFAGTNLRIYSNGRDSTAAPNGFPGILVRDSGVLRLTTSDVYSNYQGGIFGENLATIELTTSKVYNNGKQVGATTKTSVSGGTRMDGVRITDGKALTIVAGQIYDNGASGIGAYESSNYTGLTVSLNGTNIQTNYFDGLRFDCDGKLTVRNAIFEDNGGNALQIENTPTLVDLGTATSMGNNTLRRLSVSTSTGPGGRALLGDFRPARIAADGVVITVSGTTLQGTTPTAAVKIGPATDINSGQLLWEIANANNRVQFF